MNTLKIEETDMTKLNWRPHTEVPDPCVANERYLIASDDNDLDDDFYLHTSLYVCSFGEWRDLDTDRLIGSETFFWLPESELLATLPEMKK